MNYFKRNEFNKNENNFFIQNKDYVKLVHYKTKKYLRGEVPKESKGKFFSLELKNTEENTDDNDFFQIFFDGEYLQSRNTVFTLKHVTSGKELGVKLDKQTVSISSESNISTRKFYIKDCFNDQYFKDNLKNEKVKEKTLFYPSLSFFDRFIEYHQKKENFKLRKKLPINKINEELSRGG
ncbi:dolichyl-phosphate-mannose O-mannosyltransferase [Tubulinosema ratisbonensis]|uniref:Dolichyl-phosphate-mannose O-mannosyltransferase n=1 Tax=Tubulinosema ratisbonensis TaxID=291195 RepID=A0A437AIA4_9MICR|nr:dolichyl-phosphate-mannose O-mannosyltransferase [Tubulinosema ratisbonensis]